MNYAKLERALDFQQSGKITRSEYLNLLAEAKGSSVDTSSFHKIAQSLEAAQRNSALEAS